LLYEGIVESHTFVQVDKGRILGGVFIVGKQGVYYSYLEQAGKSHPREEMLDICKLVGKSLGTYSATTSDTRVIE
jgi:hypothetical protein